MKIGIDARLWNETGVGRYIRNLVNYLQLIDKNNEYILFVRNVDNENIKIKLTNSKWNTVTTNIRWHTLREQVLFHKVLEKEKLDLMHFPYFSSPVFYNKKFIVTIHDLIIYHLSTGKASTLPLPLHKIKRLAYKYVLNQAINKAEKIIVPLKSTKEDLIVSLKVPENKIVVTYEGIDESLIKINDINTNSKSNEKFFLYVGNAYPHKNLNLLIKAFISFSDKNSNIKLYLVGKNDYFYKKLERNLKVNNIKILHSINDSILLQLYRSSIAVICPSLIEGFGLVPLEAMANKVLTIASDIPAHREVCKNAVLYFNPNKVDDLVSKLSLAINMDSSSRSNYIDNGIDRTKLFSWQNMAKETLSIYEQVGK